MIKFVLVDRIKAKGKVNDTIQNAMIGIVPNPAKDEVTLSFGALAGKQGTLTVYNEMGNIIYQLNSDAISNSLEINTSNWSPDIYEIRFVTSSAIYKGKLAIINR